MDQKLFKERFENYKITRGTHLIIALYREASEIQRREILEYEYNELAFHKEQDEALDLEAPSGMTIAQMELIKELRKIDES